MAKIEIHDVVVKLTNDKLRQDATFDPDAYHYFEVNVEHLDLLLDVVEPLDEADYAMWNQNDLGSVTSIAIEHGDIATLTATNPSTGDESIFGGLLLSMYCELRSFNPIVEYDAIH